MVCSTCAYNLWGEIMGTVFQSKESSMTEGAEIPKIKCRFFHIDWIRLPLFVFGIQNVSFALLASTFSLLHWTGWIVVFALLCFVFFLVGSQYQVKGSLISPVIISLLMMLQWFVLSVFYPYIPISALPFEADPMLRHASPISTALMIPLFVGIKAGRRLNSKYRLPNKVVLTTVGAFIFAGFICVAVVFLDSDRNLGLNAGVQTFEYSDAEFGEHVARKYGDGAFGGWYTMIPPSTYRQAVFFAGGFMRYDPSAKVEVFIDLERKYWLVTQSEPDEDMYSSLPNNILIRGEDGRILAEW